MSLGGCIELTLFPIISSYLPSDSKGVGAWPETGVNDSHSVLGYTLGGYTGSPRGQTVQLCVLAEGRQKGRANFRLLLQWFFFLLLLIFKFFLVVSQFRIPPPYTTL